jgi:hypothetical protein
LSVCTSFARDYEPDVGIDETDIAQQRGRSADHVVLRPHPYTPKGEQQPRLVYAGSRDRSR